MPKQPTSKKKKTRAKAKKGAATDAPPAPFPVTKKITIPPGKLGLTCDWGQGPGILIACIREYCSLRKYGILTNDRIMTVNGHVISKSNHEEVLSGPEASTKDRVLGIHQQFYKRTKPVTAVGGAIKIRGSFNSSIGPGFIVAEVEPDSPVHGLVDVGDHIVTSNGTTIVSWKDIISLKKRTFGIIKKSALAEPEAVTRWLAQDAVAQDAVAQDAVAENPTAEATPSPPIEDTTVDVVAPPGRLSVELGVTSQTQEILVTNIFPQSPLFGQLKEGDKVLTINDWDVRRWTLADVKRLLGTTSHLERDIQICRTMTPPSFTTTTTTNNESPQKPGAKESITPKKGRGRLRKDSESSVERPTTTTTTTTATEELPEPDSPMTGEELITTTDNEHSPQVSTPTANREQPRHHRRTEEEERLYQMWKEEYELERLEQEKKKNDARKHRFARLATGCYSMSPDDGRTANTLQIYPDNDIKKSFPMLLEFGIPIVRIDENEQVDVAAATTRQSLLSELIIWNDKHRQKHEVHSRSHHKYRLIKVSAQKGSTLRSELPTMDYKEDYLRQYLKRAKIIEELLEALSQHCQATESEALDLLLRYMVKYDPNAYLKHKDYAERMKHKQQKKPPKPKPAVPDDYVDYEGNPDDPQWNISYMEVLKFKEKYGHVMVPSRHPELGGFVTRMRSAYKAKLESLTPKRIELLEKIGFMWVGRPENAKPIPGGCPRFKKAFAAKLVFPQLTFRECLYLGGYTDEEMDVNVNDKYAWRTIYTNLKDKINVRLKQWPKLTRVVGTNKGVKDLKDILESDQPDRVENVFGADKVELLEKFLADAEERQRNLEKPKAKRKRSTKARKSKKGKSRTSTQEGSSDEETEDENDDDQQQSPKKLRTVAPQAERQVPAETTDNGDMQAEGYNPLAVAAMAQPQAAAESPLAAMQFQSQQQQAAASLLGDSGSGGGGEGKSSSANNNNNLRQAASFDQFVRKMSNFW